MIYRTKLKIGEFSKMMQVTVKTLRLYEQKGLLQPDEVDEWTGYRFYSITQMQRLSTIRSLQGMGFSLAEIKEIFDNDLSVPPLEQLEQKIVECERQIHILQGRMQLLLSMRDSRKEINKMEKFSIQTLPSIIVASHREVIKNWQDIGPLCINVIGPEMHRLGCRCPMPGYCFTVEHSKEYKPTDIDIEYCEQVEEMGLDSAIIQFKRLPEVPTALCMTHYGPYERFYESFTELFRYIEEQGYHVVGQHRTVYIDGAWNQKDPEKWLSVIQVPVEK
jgi:DNA-binding transcriptional MerR regulator/effector-binding domain-containing protein